MNPPRGAARLPRLGLSIPGAAPTLGAAPARRGPPLLKLATPGNSNSMLPPSHGRVGSLSNAIPNSTQYGFAIGLRSQIRGSPDASQTGGPGSLDDINGGGSSNGIDPKEYDTMDVEHLPVEGWMRASETDRIIELGSLGEGAGGAVTRCTLRGGRTVFALKVCLESYVRAGV